MFFKIICLEFKHKIYDNIVMINFVDELTLLDFLSLLFITFLRSFH